MGLLENKPANLQSRALFSTIQIVQKAAFSLVRSSEYSGASPKTAQTHPCAVLLERHPEMS